MLLGLKSTISVIVKIATMAFGSASNQEYAVNDVCPAPWTLDLLNYYELRDSPRKNRVVNMSDLFWLTDAPMTRLEP